MSIINNVLKDLENKPNSFTPLDSSSIVIEPVGETGRGFLWVPVLLLLSVFLVFGYLLDFNLFQLDGFNNRAELQVQNQTAITRPQGMVQRPVVEQEPVSKNKLLGLQINETRGFMELIFQLEAQGQVFLKQRTKNRYIFHIRDTLNEIDSPELSNNPWLYGLSMKNDNDGLQLTFDTQQGVLVETAGATAGGQNYWLIKLKKAVVEETTAGKEVRQDKFSARAKQKPIVAVESHQPKTEISPGTDDSKSPVKLKINAAKSQPSELQRLNSAVELMHAREWSSAEQLFNGLLGTGHDRQARMYLVQTLQQQQHHAKLEALLLKSVLLYPGELTFKEIHANHLFIQKRYQELINTYARNLDSLILVNLLAASYQRSGQHEMAAAHYLKALQIDAQQPKLWISLGISQQQLGLRQDALRSYQTAQGSGIINDRLRAFLEQRIRLLSE